MLRCMLTGVVFLCLAPALLNSKCRAKQMQHRAFTLLGTIPWAECSAFLADGGLGVPCWCWLYLCSTLV